MGCGLWVLIEPYQSFEVGVPFEPNMVMSGSDFKGLRNTGKLIPVEEYEKRPKAKGGKAPMVVETAEALPAPEVASLTPIPEPAKVAGRVRKRTSAKKEDDKK